MSRPLTSIRGPRAWLRSSHAQVLALYAVATLGLLGPMASTVLVPHSSDMGPHLLAVMEAREALAEGQLPLRVAPRLSGGHRYALFQFYGQAPYTLMGLLHLTVFPDNAYLALRTVVAASFLAGAFFLWRLARAWGAARVPAALAGLAYIAAPYLLVNLHARGAIAEVIAQGLLPAGLYFLTRFVLGGRARHFVPGTLAFALLLLTHLITAFYNGLAAALLVVWIARARPKRLLRAALVGLAALGLCAYALAPAQAAGAYLRVARAASSLASTAWLTPLMSLLAPGSVSPVPTVAGEPLLWAPIHPAVGWPLLAGVLGIVGLWLQGTRVPRRTGVLLLIFALGLFAAWSPVDLWSRLPALASIGQFSYRLLAVTMWSGALLLALALTLLLPRAHPGATLLGGALLIGSSAAPYLVSAPALNGGPAAAAIQRGDFAHAPTDPLTALRPLWRAPIDDSGRRAYAARLEDFSVLPEPLAIECPPAAGVPLACAAPVAARASSERSLRSLSLRAPQGSAALVASGADAEASSVRVLLSSGLGVQRVHAPPGVGGFYEPATAVQDGDVMRVTVAAAEPALVVLPMQFHPGLLRVRIDGQPADYLPFGRRHEVFTAVAVAPGQHVVEAYFGGLAWANNVSLAFALALAPLAWLMARARRRVR